MKLLLISGPGPGIKNQDFLAGSLFDTDRGGVAELCERAYDGFDLSDLGFDYRGRSYPLMRPRRDAVPHLTTFTLTNLLQQAGAAFTHLDAGGLWDGTASFPPGDFDALLLSTTYIWDMRSLGLAISWLKTFSDAPLILGGQFSNLKYDEILTLFPQVHAILRGDGEPGIPALIGALAGRIPWDRVPGVAMTRNRERLQTALVNADLDRDCSVPLKGAYDVVPYESMRGCPYNCKFCSFPMASPIWRYKSGETIASDWRRYKEENGARFIKAMDSTFTIPHTRMRQLFELLPGIGIDWEAYSRANVISSSQYLDRLAESRCRFLSIGFESMNATSLASMNKQVTVEQNRRAFDLLVKGGVGYRCSFMTGYPGETPDEFADTQAFLLDEYRGHFMLSVFSLADEQMPVWRDAERFSIEILDPENPDYSWRHSGMDHLTARALNHSTLDRVRVSNPHAVLLLWQARYQHWLMPHLSAADNLKIEKLVEQIGFLARDVPDAGQRRQVLEDCLGRLGNFGIYRGPKSRFISEALMEA